MTSLYVHGWCECQTTKNFMSEKIMFYLVVFHNYDRFLIILYACGLQHVINRYIYQHEKGHTLFILLRYMHSHREDISIV